MAKTIYVLNGPNLNSLGTREPEKYGHSTLKDVEKLCRKTAERSGLEGDFRQTNREGERVEWLHEAKAKKAAGIVINPAGYTTTSIATSMRSSRSAFRQLKCTSPTSISAKNSATTPMCRRERKRLSAALASTVMRLPSRAWPG